jgi:hypothetical protein
MLTEHSAFGLSDARDKQSRLMLKCEWRAPHKPQNSNTPLPVVWRSKSS